MVRMMRVRVTEEEGVRVRDRVPRRCKHSTAHHAYPMTMTPLADMGCCFCNICLCCGIRLSRLHEPNELLDHVLNELLLARGRIYTFSMLL